MHVLSLDTTTRAGSVALVVDDRVVDERGGDASRTHAERLPAALVSLAEANGLQIADIDVFAVASGPGSFTGLRIGIATVQGFALTTGRPMVGISALDALAQIASADAAAGTSVAVWTDAHRREVFAVLYRITSAPLYEPERLTIVDGPIVADPASTLERWQDCLLQGPATFIGDGAIMYAETIVRTRAFREPPVPPPPLAGAIGRMATARARRGDTIAPSAIQPLYVRRPDAELDREKRSGVITG